MADYFFLQVAPHTYRITKLEEYALRPEAIYHITAGACNCPGAFRADKPQGCKHHDMLGYWLRQGANPWLYLDAKLGWQFLPILGSLRKFIEENGLGDFLKVPKQDLWRVAEQGTQVAGSSPASPATKVVKKLEDMGL